MFFHVILFYDLRVSTKNGKQLRPHANDIPFGELGIAELNQHQVFVADPAGTTVELNFLLANSDS